ncbi:putative porin POR2 [Saccharomyces cerevisiae S288C]|uniref:Non-selective voltage-gated ion channel 2 n=2 Tax=Saccharomyces cerevisiae TaxID=4932 RepID=VDAC2_YEAST|eukprot:NP_012152.3 putative porin POR2 [Saccharomyces cerevisiae S288C]
MALRFFNDISRDVNGLFNRDFFHTNPLSLNISTTTENGVNFTLKAKQGVTEGPIQTSVEGRFYDRKEGVSLSQSWSNQNRLNTRIEFSKIAPGWKGDVNAFLTPQSIKNAKFNLSYAQKSFAARTSIDILQPKDFVGSVTLGHRGFVGGTDIAYDTAAGLCARYAMSIGYLAREYSFILSTNNRQCATASFFQNVNRYLQVGTKATLQSKTSSNMNIEFVTRYVPDSISQVKAKIADSGLTTLSYKRNLNKDISLGVGMSFNALQLTEPVHKFGWSLSFSP